MLDFPRWKQILLWFVTAACALATLPTIVSAAGYVWPASLPAPMINLGLDLAGGSHLLLEADSNQIRQLRLSQMEESVQARMAKAEPRIGIGDISTKDGKVSFMLNDPSKADAAREELQTLTSGAGTTGQRDWDLAVNGGLIVLTRYMAKEFSVRGIRVNAVAPGSTRTRISDDAFERFPEVIPALAAKTALGRVGEPDDIGPVIASLLAEESGWITAQNIEVSGGFNL